MECPYLEHLKESAVCAASTANASPALDERNCRTEEHENCTTLMGHLLRSSMRPETRRLN